MAGDMDRRNFLRSMVGGVAAAAAVRTFPFRVFSFPNRITRWVGIDWANGSSFSTKDDFIWIVNSDQAAAIQALELETFAHEIPTLFENESTLYKHIRRSDHKLWTGGTFLAR